MADFAATRGLNVADVKTTAGALRDISQKYGEFAVDAALAAGGALPPPFGTAADAASLAKSLGKGDWWGAAFDVIGFVPLLGDAVKGGRVLNKLADLGRAVDELAAGAAKMFGKTEDAAKAFWASKKNMDAYREALAKCSGTKSCLDDAANLKGQQYGSTPRSGNSGQWNPPNGRGDGEWVPTPGSPLAEAIKPRTSVTYENGFPKFEDYSQGSVKIPLSGDSRRDLELASEMYRKQTGNADWTMPNGMTWHHYEDGTTMMLVPSQLNLQARHAGGAALFGDTATGREF